MPNPKHSELEIKMDARNVDRSTFLDWCDKKKPIYKVFASGPDVFYVNGKHVIRHRHSRDGSFNQATVKLRKSDRSTLDRVEIDLDFSESTTVEDVSKFFLASGWEKSFTIIKDAWVIWVDNVSIVYYRAYRKDKPLKKRVYIEVEVEKDSGLSVKKSKKVLESWRKDISSNFKVGEPLNKSLWEIFSGKKAKKKGK